MRDRYRVNIDGRAYEGNYDSAANAVFGFMLKDLFANGAFTDMVIHVALIPPEPRTKGYRRINLACKICGSRLRNEVTKLCICKKAAGNV